MLSYDSGSLLTFALQDKRSSGRADSVGLCYHRPECAPTTSAERRRDALERKGGFDVSKWVTEASVPHQSPSVMPKLFKLQEPA